MSIDATHSGTPSIPPPSHLSSTSEELLEQAVQAVSAKKDLWLSVSVSDRIQLLDSLIDNLLPLGKRWVDANIQAKSANPSPLLESEEWSAGVLSLMYNLTQLRQSLRDIQKNGKPRIPGPVTTRPNGQVVARVFPQNIYDRLFYQGVRAEIWFNSEVTKENLQTHQAINYSQTPTEGKVALVLGAGNVSGIGPMDILYKLFAENQVVVFKANPVNAYLIPLMEELFQPLIEADFLRLVEGGASEGAFLCNHPSIDEIHVTGSDKTFDAIVFGSGPDAAQKKASNQPATEKRVTGELGNVSPVIVVPGPWTDSDLRYQAEHLATMLTNNAGYNCNATRVIVQHAAWAERATLLQKIRDVLGRIPPRRAYYPGAFDRYKHFAETHPGAEEYGQATEDQLPWMLIPNLDSTQTDDPCFQTEAFCSVFAETALEAASPARFLNQAVKFCNNQLWGSLNVTILVHPATLNDPEMQTALEQAIADLRYGTVAVNYWAATSFVLSSTSWGAYPGHALSDIQSGTGIVHNTLLFEQVQKTVLLAPFISFPTPPWFVTRSKQGAKVFPQIVDFTARPGFKKALRIALSAL